MSDVKQFNIAAREADKEREGKIEFKVDDQELVVYKPDSAQYAMLLATTGRGSSEMERIAGTLNFFVKIMDDRSASYIESRLLDFDDPFGIEDVEDILKWLTEEWSGRPTQPPSDSTLTPQSTGAASTQPTLLSN